MRSDRTRIHKDRRGSGEIRARRFLNVAGISKLTLLAAIGAFCTSCSVLQAPLSPPTMSPQDSYHAAADGIEIDALPVLTWNQNWHLFDDNLPAIGLLPIWIEMRDSSGRGIDLGSVKWELVRGSERLRPAGLDRVFKQYYKNHHVRIYSVLADHEARETLSDWMLQPRSTGPAQSSKGFLFFRTQSPQSPDWNRGAILIIKGLAGGDYRRTGRRALELPLFHAHE